MIASRVTPPTEEEGAKVDGAKEVGAAVVCVWGRYGLSYASLRQTVTASMAPMMKK